MFQSIEALDQQLEQFIYLHRPGGVVDFMRWTTEHATLITLGILGVALIYGAIYKKKKLTTNTFQISLVIGISALISGGLKILLMRARPYKVLDSIHTPLVNSGGYSFPSGHTTEVFALAVAIFLLYKNPLLRIIALIWAVFIAYTRMALGVHFPLDILGGIIIGSGVAYLWLKFNPFQHKQI